jgi:hypothetical protein
VSHQCLAHQPFLCWVFLRYSLTNYLPRAGFDYDLPDLCSLE